MDKAYSTQGVMNIHTQVWSKCIEVRHNDVDQSKILNGWGNNGLVAMKLRVPQQTRNSLKSRVTKKCSVF
jgi:hypothetical protein